MQNKFIEGVEADHRKKDVPDIEIGNTVSVGVRIVEGSKERIQPFIGVIIARRGKGMNEMFTVRRIVANEGVERIFPLHSPRVVGVEVMRRGKVRRSKLYYLRDRVGKARKLRERRVSSAKVRRGDTAPGAGEAPAAEASPPKEEVAATV